MKERTIIMVKENGNSYVSLKWFVSILVAILLSAAGSWAMQRHAFETETFSRLAVLEKNQARVLERLDANAQMLTMIYTELKEHRNKDGK